MDDSRRLKAQASGRRQRRWPKFETAYRPQCTRPAVAHTIATVRLPFVLTQRSFGPLAEVQKGRVLLCRTRRLVPGSLRCGTTHTAQTQPTLFSGEGLGVIEICTAKRKVGARFTIGKDNRTNVSFPAALPPQPFCSGFKIK